VKKIIYSGLEAMIYFFIIVDSVLWAAGFFANSVLSAGEKNTVSDMLRIMAMISFFVAVLEIILVIVSIIISVKKRRRDEDILNYTSKRRTKVAVMGMIMCFVLICLKVSRIYVFLPCDYFEYTFLSVAWDFLYLVLATGYFGIKLSHEIKRERVSRGRFS